MPRTCFFCGKSVDFGHTVSHAHNVGPRRWNPNLQTVKALVDGKPKRVDVCTRCIRTGKFQKAK